MSDHELFIRCSCHSPEHMLILDTWDWRDGWPELLVSVSLCDNHPWWRRAARAFEYALTGRTRRNMWAETVVRLEDAVRLRDYLNVYIASAGETRRADTPQSESVEDEHATAESRDAHTSPDGGQHDTDI